LKAHVRGSGRSSGSSAAHASGSGSAADHASADAAAGWATVWADVSINSATAAVIVRSAVARPEFDWVSVAER